jgi:hypothetical protein
MCISIRPGKIRINLFIVHAGCVAKINLSEMALEALPCCLFLCLGSLRTSVLPGIVGQLLEKPMRHPSLTCTALNEVEILDVRPTLLFVYYTDERIAGELTDDPALPGWLSAEPQRCGRHKPQFGNSLHFLDRRDHLATEELFSG